MSEGSDLPTLQVAFRIADRSKWLLTHLRHDFTGAEVEGDLAVRCGAIWLGRLKGDSASEPAWFGFAPIWNFVWDLVHVCLQLKGGGAGGTIEIEGTPVSLRIQSIGDQVRVEEHIVSPDQPGGRIRGEFSHEFGSQTVGIQALLSGASDAVDRLLTELQAINPRIMKTDWVKKLRKAKASLASVQ